VTLFLEQFSDLVNDILEVLQQKGKVPWVDNDSEMELLVQWPPNCDFIQGKDKKHDMSLYRAQQWNSTKSDGMYHQ
jgi:hypothetical protein